MKKMAYDKMKEKAEQIGLVHERTILSAGRNEVMESLSGVAGGLPGYVWWRTFPL